MAVTAWPILIAQQQLGGQNPDDVHVCFSYGGADGSTYGGASDGFTYAGTATQTFTYGGEC